MRGAHGLARVAAIAAWVGASGCSSSPTGTLQLVTGGEDAGAVFDGVATLDVVWIDADAGSHSLKSASLAAGAAATSIDLGSVDPNSVGMIEVTGEDAAGKPVLFGSTIPLQFGVLAGANVKIFVQRMGELARMPSPPSDARNFPIGGVLGGRYLVRTGGNDPTNAEQISIYDFLSLQSLSSPPSFTRAPESLAFSTIGSAAYVIDTNGMNRVDFGDSGSTPVTLPSGGPTAADIAGGATIAASGGVQYVVGATRTTRGPTKAILKIDSAGTLSWALLDSARMGASALWMDSLGGLVVIGGNEIGDDAGAGVEVVSGTSGVAHHEFPPDPTLGAGAATLDNARSVVVAGGLAPDGSDPGVRLLDVSGDCGSSCTTTWPAIPTTLAFAQVFASNPKSAVVVGNELVGLRTRAFTLSSAGVAEVPLKVPRIAASAVAYPLGTPGSFLVTGGAPEIEAFVPLPPATN